MIRPILQRWEKETAVQCAAVLSRTMSRSVFSVISVVQGFLALAATTAMLTGCNTIKPAKAYPTFRGAMTWSINWDKHDGYNFSVPTRAALNALP